MMKSQFTQIYAEVGVAFDLPHLLLKALRAKLDALGKTVPVFAKRFKTDDFVIDYIISATRRSGDLHVKGPGFLRKRPRVEFSIFIPYVEIADHGERMAYVLDQVGAGIREVLERYGVDSSGVEDCVREMIALVQSGSQDYQAPPKVVE